PLAAIVELSGGLRQRGAQEEQGDAHADEGGEQRGEPPELAEDREEEPHDRQGHEKRQQPQHGVDEEGWQLLHGPSLEATARRRLCGRAPYGRTLCGRALCGPTLCG